jgi:DNA-binding SARP family transcriptional activator
MGAGTVQLNLLGGFELRVDERPVDLPFGTRRLVAFLALRDRPVNRAFVAGNLWLDKSEQRANANLRSALWRLPTIDDEIVFVKGRDVSLSKTVQVDVRRIEALAHDADLDGNDDNALPSGPLLPDWPDEWLVLERERFRQLQLSALEARCDRLVNRGHIALAINTAWSAVRIEPLRESPHRCMVRAHLASGNTVEALRHYDLFARFLDEELGLAPSPAMEDLLLPYRRERARVSPA